jgi:hypothetical protein
MCFIARREERKSETDHRSCLAARNNLPVRDEAVICPTGKSSGGCVRQPERGAAFERENRVRTKTIFMNHFKPIG